MKRKTALSTRSTLAFIVLILMNIAGIIAVDDLKFKAVMTILLLALISCLYYLIVLPHLNIKKQYKMFLNGQIYEELFQNPDYLTPETVKVMDRFHYLLNKQDAINMSKKQAEYLALQNQINPHFLYNTLEAIRGDALYAGLASIAETTEALASFFRYTITDVGNLVTLEDELENIENYFTIQQYRFGDKFKLTINYPDNEDILLNQVPKLTLQPIIENAIFHGLEGKSQGGNIFISIESTRKNLFISVKDDGLGIPSEVLTKINDSLERVAVSYVNSDKRKSGGIALKNVCRRIKLIFGDEYGVHVYSTVNVGTDVRLTLPKIPKHAE